MRSVGVVLRSVGVVLRYVGVHLKYVRLCNLSDEVFLGYVGVTQSIRRSSFEMCWGSFEICWGWVTYPTK